MPKRQMDDQTRSLIDQIDERLRDAERLRHHVNNPQPDFWPDRRRNSRIPGAPREHIRDDGKDAGSVVAGVPHAGGPASETEHAYDAAACAGR
jgi:hypothetical protein